MQSRYVINWFNLRDERISLVARATDGDTAAYDQLHALTRDALLFSIYAVRNPVALQEAYFCNTQAGHHILHNVKNLDGKNRKGTLALHVKAVKSVDAWMAKYFSLDLFDDLSGHTFAATATKCFGLKWAKAFYAAGCLAFDNAGCIDTWMAGLHGIEQKSLSSKKGYDKAYASTGWTHTLQQWADFLIVEAFATNQHDCWFAHTLGTKALVA